METTNNSDQGNQTNLGTDKKGMFTSFTAKFRRSARMSDKSVEMGPSMSQEGTRPEMALGSSLEMEEKPSSRKNLLLWIIVGVILVAIIAALVYFFVSPKETESPTFSAIRKGELVGTGVVGSKVMVGSLEVTLQEVIEGSYRPLELDAQGNRVTKNYFAAKIMIFNTDPSGKEFLLFGLTDELGGQYERDTDVEFYVDTIKDFGPAKEIYSRTIREGYLVFEDPGVDAKNLQLTILSETTNKKVVFDIAR